MNELIIRAILIDDDENYANELIGLAADHNISIKYNKYLQTAIEENPDFTEVDFIILDAQSIIDEEDTAPDFDFLPSSLRTIDEIEVRRGYFIPKCINTGYPEHIKVKRHQNKIKVFEKTTQQNDLFAFIKTVVYNSENYQLINQHKDVFEIFEKGLLDQALSDVLIALLKPIPKHMGLKETKDYAANIRSVQEALYKTLHNRYPKVLDDSHFNTLNHMLDFNKAKFTLSAKAKVNNKIEHNKNEDLQGSDIENLSTAIYWVCGNILHYNTKEFNPHIAGPYTIQSLIYALMEQLIWYKKLIEKLERNL